MVDYGDNSTGNLPSQKTGSSLLGGLRKVKRFLNLQNRDGGLSSHDGSRRKSAGTGTESELTLSQLNGVGMTKKTIFGKEPKKDSNPQFQSASDDDADAQYLPYNPFELSQFNRFLHKQNKVPLDIE